MNKDVSPSLILKFRTKANAFLEKLAVLSARTDLLFGKSVSPGAEVVLGHGKNKYQVVPNWAKCNAKDFPVNNCHEMVIDDKDRIILLTDHPANNILIFSDSGEVLDSWTLNLQTAHGLTIGKEADKQFLLICDYSSGRVIKTDLSGNIIMELPSAHELGIYTKYMPYDPTETAVAPNGDIYVVDGYGSYFVLHFNARGDFLRYFGGKGKYQHSLKNPHGIVVDTRNQANAPELIITSRLESCFKRFTLKGEYISNIALPGAFPCRPVIHDKKIYSGICWSQFLFKPNSGFVVILDEFNKVISCPGGIQPIYNDLGMLQKLSADKERIFMHCHDVCVDRNDNIYVCQWNARHTYPIKLKKI